MKRQTRKGSLCEISFNMSIGIFIGWVANMVILPMFGHDVSGTDSLWIVCMFTVISFIRGYVVRRIFNWYQGRTSGDLI